MKLSSDIAELKTIADSTFTAAMRKLNWSHTRSSAARAFMVEAEAAGLTGDDARWVASKNLSSLGYGGGL